MNWGQRVRRDGKGVEPLEPLANAGCAGTAALDGRRLPVSPLCVSGRSWSVGSTNETVSARSCDINRPACASRIRSGPSYGSSD
jgi:hypothetical protein